MQYLSFVTGLFYLAQCSQGSSTLSQEAWFPKAKYLCICSSISVYITLFLFTCWGTFRLLLFLATVNKASVKMNVQMSPQDPFFKNLGYIPRSWIAEFLFLFFLTFWGTSIPFFITVVLFCIFQCLHILPTLCVCLFLIVAILMGVKWYLTVFWFSLIITDVELLFMNLLAICVSSLKKRLFKLLFSRQVMTDSLWPHGLPHTRLPCPSLSPGVCPSSCPLNRWCHPTISFSVTLFSFCLQSRSESGSSPPSAICIRWPKY